MRLRRLPRRQKRMPDDPFRPKKHSRPERVNYLASVSDLMSALLFVFILTLAVAIIQARTAAGRADEEARHAKEAAERARVALENLNQVQGRLTIVEERLEGNSRALKAFLEQLKTSLEEQGIMVDIDTVRGVLRVPESAVTFGVGLNTLDDSNLEKVKIIGNVLEKELPAISLCP